MIRIAGGFAVLLLLSACATAPPPNLSGTWKLNPARSRFEPGTQAPVLWIDEVEHREPELKLKSKRQSPDSFHTATYTTDGREACNVIDSYMVCSRARWDGPMLRIDSTVRAEKGDIAWQERWSLARDGRSLTVDRQGRAPRYLFLERR